MHLIWGHVIIVLNRKQCKVSDCLMPTFLCRWTSWVLLLARWRWCRRCCGAGWRSASSPPYCHTQTPDHPERVQYMYIPGIVNPRLHNSIMEQQIFFTGGHLIRNKCYILIQKVHLRCIFSSMLNPEHSTIFSIQRMWENCHKTVRKLSQNR